MVDYKKKYLKYKKKYLITKKLYGGDESLNDNNNEVLIWLESLFGSKKGTEYYKEFKMEAERTQEVLTMEFVETLVKGDLKYFEMEKEHIKDVMLYIINKKIVDFLEIVAEKFEYDELKNKHIEIKKLLNDLYNEEDEEDEEEDVANVEEKDKDEANLKIVGEKFKKIELKDQYGNEITNTNVSRKVLKYIWINLSKTIEEFNNRDTLLTKDMLPEGNDIKTQLGKYIQLVEYFQLHRLLEGEQDNPDLNLHPLLNEAKNAFRYLEYKLKVMNTFP